MRLLTWIVVVPLAVLFVAFAVANRALVTVSFDPLPYLLELPLFLLIFGAVFLGLLAGGAAAWLANRRWRRAARDNARRADRLEAETRTLRAELARHEAGAPESAGRGPTLIDAA